jgi:hypothetical protein
MGRNYKGRMEGWGEKNELIEKEEEMKPLHEI